MNVSLADLVILVGGTAVDAVAKRLASVVGTSVTSSSSVEQSPHADGVIEVGRGAIAHRTRSLGPLTIVTALNQGDRVITGFRTCDQFRCARLVSAERGFFPISVWVVPDTGETTGENPPPGPPCDYSITTARGVDLVVRSLARSFPAPPCPTLSLRPAAPQSVAELTGTDVASFDVFGF